MISLRLCLLEMSSSSEAVPFQVAHRVFSKMANTFHFAMSDVHSKRILPAMDEPACNISCRDFWS